MRNKETPPVERRRLRGLAPWLLAGTLTVVAHAAIANPEYLALWGPAVGEDAPMLAASDQAGNPHTLTTLTGPKGLLLVFSRSVDW